MLLYEKEDILEAFHIVPLVQMVQPFLFDRLQIRDDIIWKTISSILNWRFGGAMYINFYNVTHDASVIIVEFWSLLIHTLRGQYESFTCNVDAIFRKHMHFKRLLDSILIFREDGGHITLMYIVPVIWETMCVNSVYGFCCYNCSCYRLHFMFICSLGGVDPNNHGDMVYKYGINTLNRP